MQSGGRWFINKRWYLPLFCVPRYISGLMLVTRKLPAACMKEGDSFGIDSYRILHRDHRSISQHPVTVQPMQYSATFLPNPPPKASLQLTTQHPQGAMLPRGRHPPFNPSKPSSHPPPQPKHSPSSEPSLKPLSTRPRSCDAWQSSQAINYPSSAYTFTKSSSRSWPVFFGFCMTFLRFLSRIPSL
jgi:hypothetical protein